MQVTTYQWQAALEQGVSDRVSRPARNSWTVECGPKDVVWVGQDIRIFVTSRLDDLTLLLVTAPNGAVLAGLTHAARSAPADPKRTSHILSLCSGERFEIGGVSVCLEDYRLPDLDATPLRDRLLHIEAPPGWTVTRDSGAHRGGRATTRQRVHS